MHPPVTPNRESEIEDRPPLRHLRVARATQAGRLFVSSRRAAGVGLEALVTELARAARRDDGLTVRWPAVV